jgi:hypothetical protein
MKKKDVLKNWFSNAITLNHKLPIPNNGLYADLMSIIYESNGNPETICVTILGKGLLKSTNIIRKHLSFMTRIGMIYKTKYKKIEIRKEYLPSNK